jgi:uncharacterized protein
MLVQIELVQIESAGARLTAVPPAAVHRFRSEFGEHVLVVNGSRVFSLPDDVAAALDRASVEEIEPLLEGLGISSAPYIVDAPLSGPPLRSLSLAIAQRCNLACTYCYAQEGGFGREERAMSRETAFAAVDLLFAGAGPGDRVQLTFLGGEPLTHRELLYECTERAAILSVRRGVRVGFSLTTNGTLVTPEDAGFFERHGFSVTVSLDGVGEANDRQRMFKDGRGSYRRVLDRVQPLIQAQRRMQVSARVTVTPDNLRLRETLIAFLDLGFHSVGFSPMLRSPGGSGEMSAFDLEAMLAAMIECGREFEGRVHRGERFAFANLYTALHEIHKGTHRPYPCGAGAGYFGVSAEGGIYACHRFVEDPAGWMGNVGAGVDRVRQDAWLHTRHVHRQEPCRSCWARYLCGGGCHHEVIHRGRPACDYIRGWLGYCLQAYTRMLEIRPRFFEA